MKRQEKVTYMCKVHACIRVYKHSGICAFFFNQYMFSFRRNIPLEETITNERHRPVQNTRRTECYSDRYQEKGRYL